ncbi:C4-dicarboxylate ABC transporter [Halioglobus maricola]|uniref:C4-dicarboxylate ABC transporter n=1 Tax=Halioglobus maricola TaxID=2601894 RepID=A0A5P9NPN6_9GAMM|nr:Na+/H+ antiporter NhaC family protein [Halioglobus maricola]QFU77244.1 C4-dicarboxylate ABC transporter [Halioglobus maricola]
MSDPNWTVLLPPLLAIGLALLTRQVYLALFTGIWLGYFLLDGGLLHSLAGAIDASVAVLASPGDAKVIVFTLVIGAFILTLERSGGVTGFIQFLERRSWVNSGRRAQWMAWLIGVVIFIESNITVLVAGTVSRPLFDRFKVAREKLAYLIDSTSAPICILIPFNAWGAFNLGLLEGLGVEEPLRVLLTAIPMNIYAIAAVLLAAYTVTRNFNPGPMAEAERRAQAGESQAVQQDLGVLQDSAAPNAWNMLLPVLCLVGAMPVFLLITGDGDMFAGSGSTSVLWASLLALTLVSVLVLWQRSMGLEELSRTWMKGAGEMLPIATVLLLALALGGVSKALGTGVYVAGMVGDTLPAWILPASLFLVSGFIAFSVGSSWGTFSIMLPIAIPIAAAMGVEPALFVAAVLSGGIFGDHGSPISDTTIVSSMASGTEHIEHVRTQLPYALIAGGVSVVGFLVLGLLFV